jgi:hypothetical protein
MLFFRSEEHLRNWDQFDPANKEGIISLADLVKLFSSKYFTNRFDTDYVSKMREYIGEFISDLKSLNNAGSFWKL